MKSSEKSAILQSGISPSYQAIDVDETPPSTLQLREQTAERNKAIRSVSLDDVALPKVDVKVAPRASEPHKRRTTGYESLDFSRSPSQWRRNAAGVGGGGLQPQTTASDPNSVTRWAVNGAIGVGVGITSFLLKESVSLIFGYRQQLIERYVPKDGEGVALQDWVISAWAHLAAFAAVLVLLSSLFVVLVEPLAAGSGIPETMSSLNGLVLPKAFTGKVLTCKFFSCLLAVGSGLPAGPEGPMIHMGGILGVIISQGRVRRLIRCTPRPLRQWLEGAVLTFRNARDRRDFMAAGVAGGVAAAFGAPVGGLLFVAEELATHWDVGLGMQVFFCAIAACSANRLLGATFPGLSWAGTQTGTILDEDAMMFLVNKPVHVNIHMFVPVMVLGVMTGLGGALYNRLCMRTAAFRRQYIRPRQMFFLLEPVLVAVLYVACVTLIPTLFTCVPVDCNALNDAPSPSSSSDGSNLGLPPVTTTAIHGVDVCARVGQSSIEVNTGVLVAYGCPKKEYNPSATLLLHSMDKTLKSLFARGFHYQYDYLPLLAMLSVWLPTSAYLNGISCCTGIVIPCLVSGALIGRLFGLLLTDLYGVHNGDINSEWIDPGAFALIGAAGFFAGVSRLTMSLTVIITEISNDTHFTLPIMAGIMVAKWVADYTNTQSLYHSIIDAKELPYLPQQIPNAKVFDSFTAGQAASKAVVSVPQRPKVSDLAAMLLANQHNAFPVLRSSNGKEGVFLGLVQRPQLEALLLTPELWQESPDASPMSNGIERHSSSSSSFSSSSQYGENDDASSITFRNVHRSSSESQSVGRIGSESGEVGGENGPKEEDEQEDDEDDNGDEEASAAEGDHRVHRLGAGGAAADEWLPEEGAGDSFDHKFNRGWRVGPLQVNGTSVFDKAKEAERRLHDRLKELASLSGEEEDGNLSVDLTPYADSSCFTVCQGFALRNTYDLFRTMGMRHLVVVDSRNHVRGMITRGDLLESSLKKLH